VRGIVPSALGEEEAEHVSEAPFVDPARPWPARGRASRCVEEKKTECVPDALSAAASSDRPGRGTGCAMRRTG
jgi:hypothetical protein